MAFYGMVLLITILAVAAFARVSINQGSSFSRINAAYATAYAATSLAGEQVVIADEPVGSMLNYTAAASGMHVALLNGTYIVTTGNGYVYSVT